MPSWRLHRAPLAIVAIVAASGCAAPAEDVGSNESAVTVCGQTTIKGIDVYHNDNGGKAINWAAVKSAGIDFAFAKATESINFTDSQFATNWAGMKSAGLVRGAYHFFHSDVDAAEQAQFFLTTVGAVSPGDLLVLDLESANGETQATISSRAATFLATVKSATGMTPLLYVSPAFLSSFASFGSYPLWVANYGVSCPDVPAPWATYAFWQSTGTGSLGPISGAVDLDTFNGTLTELQALGGTPKKDGGADDASPPSDASSDSAASDGAATGPQPRVDGGAQPAAGGDGAQEDSGCSIGPRERRGSRTAGIAGLAGLFAIGLRRRRK